MKKILILLLFLLPSNLFAQINWQRNYSSAQRIARQTGKPMIIDFTANWCKPCQQMEKEFWVLPQVASALRGFVAVKLDYDFDKSLAQRYGSKGIPFVVFTDPLGNLITYRLGFSRQAGGEMGRIISKMPENYSDMMPLYDAVEKDKNDGASWLELAYAYEDAGLILPSCEFYRKALKTPVIQNDAKKKEKVMAMVGLNYYKIQDFDNAANFLDDYLKQQPNGKNRAEVLLTFVITQAYRGKIKDAENLLVQLKTEFPDSKSIGYAEREIENAKNRNFKQ